MTCELRDLERKTKIYYEDPSFIIIDCKSCKIPMIILRRHSMILSISELSNIIEVVRKKFGKNVELRMNQRKIPDHWHVHIIVNEKDKAKC